MPGLLEGANVVPLCDNASPRSFRRSNLPHFGQESPDTLRRKPSVQRTKRLFQLFYPTARAFSWGDARATPEQIEQALRDVTLFGEILPTSPTTAITELRVQTAIMEVGEEYGWDVMKASQKAALAAKEIDKFPKFGLARYCRMQYYRQIDAQDLAEREMHEVLELGWGGRSTKAMKLYGQGDMLGA